MYISCIDFNIWICSVLCFMPTAVRLSNLGIESSHNANTDQNIEPRHYDVLFRIDVEKYWFTGNVTIFFDLAKTSDYIPLNIGNLSIFCATLRDTRTNILIPIAEMLSDAEEFMLNIKLGYFIEPSRYKLLVVFSSMYYQSMLGWSQIGNIGGKEYKKYLLRSSNKTIFPHFDAGTYKSTFQISVIHPETQIVISNAPLKEKRTVSNVDIKSVFRETPPMKLDSVALLTGHLFNCNREKIGDEKIGIYSTIDAQEETLFAAELILQLVEVYKAYFGNTYPFQKIDFVHFPGDDDKIVKWGLISAREECFLLKNPENVLAAKSAIYKCVIESLIEMISQELPYAYWVSQCSPADIRNFYYSFTSNFGDQRKNLDFQMSDMRYIFQDEEPQDINLEVIQVIRTQHGIVLKQQVYSGDGNRIISESLQPLELVVTFYNSTHCREQTIVFDSPEIFVESKDADGMKLNTNPAKYLVNYDDRDWKYLYQLMKDKRFELTPEDRTKLLSDAFVLADIGLVSWDLYFNMTSYLPEEKSSSPWRSVFRSFLKLANRSPAPIAEYIREIAWELTKNIYTDSMWEEHRDLQEREYNLALIDVSCWAGNKKCLDKASSYVKEWIKEKRIQTNFNHMTQKYGFIGLNNQESEEIMKQLQVNYKDEVTFEQIDILQSFLTTKTTFETETFVVSILKDISLEYFVLLISFMAENPNGCSILSSYFLNSYTDIKLKFSDQENLFNWVLHLVFSFGKTKEDLIRVYEFYQHKGIPIDHIAMRIIKTIKRNIAWNERNENRLTYYFQSRMSLPWVSERLTGSAIPLTYYLKFYINLTEPTFNAKVSIIVEIMNDTDTLLLHSKGLKVSKYEVTHVLTNKTQDILQTFLYTPNDYLIIRFKNVIPAGMYNLSFTYEAHYVSTLMGFVRRTSIDNAEVRTCVFTKMEPIYARKVFPCFDEPHFKAKFMVSVISESYHQVLSNMPQENAIELDGGLVETNFMVSWKMSTYLVSVVVGNFSYTEAKLFSGQTLRFFAHPNLVNRTSHGLNRIPMFLKRLDLLLNYTFNFPKLDFVALPYYPGNAMENWGLIYLSERLLVTNDSIQSSIYQSEKTITHELAHHWFGNLVTMLWWNDVWLNEGLSNWAAFHVLQELHGEEFFMHIEGKSKSMRYEEKASSNSVIMDVKTTEDIQKMFSFQTYTKGYSIALMLHVVLKDDFLKGISIYLKKHSFENAETQNLLDDLSEASSLEINITEAVNTWTKQNGFPCIEVQRNARTIKLTQAPFIPAYPAPECGEHSNENKKWIIPLTYRAVKENVAFHYWLTVNETTLQIPEKYASSCIKFNTNFTGYYVIKYDEISHNLLVQTLNAKSELYTAWDRYNLLFDSAFLASAYLQTLDRFLDLSRYLQWDRNLQSWSLFQSEIFSIAHKVVHNEEIRDLLQRYILQLTEGHYNSSEKSESKSYFDNVVRGIACFAGNKQCIDNHLENIETYWSGKRIINQFVSGIIGHIQNASVWNEIFAGLSDQYNVSSFIDLLKNHNQSVLNKAQWLCSYRNPSFLNRTLAYFLLDQRFSSNDLEQLFRSALRNADGMNITVPFILNNWIKVVKRIKNIRTLITYDVCSYLSTLEKLKEMTNFMKQHAEVFSVKDRNQCAKVAERQISWMHYHLNPIKDALERVLKNNS